MYDYKFRHDDLTFRKPKRRFRKLFLRGVGFLLIAGLVYAATQLDLPWTTSEQSEGAESDVIPLTLPPHSDPPQGSHPVQRAPVQPGPAGAGEVVAKAMQVIEGGTESASISAAQPSTTGPERPILPDARDGIETAYGMVVEDDTGFSIEHVVKQGDSLAKIFRHHDLSPRLLQSILNSSDQRRRLGNIRPGDRLRIRLDPDRQFSEFNLRLDALRSIRLTSTGNGVASSLVRRQTDVHVTAASGTIKHTLFDAAQRAGIPDAVTMKMAAIFGWDIDFALEIRAGDRFSVVYEELWADGESVSSAAVLAAKFVNQGNTYRAVRYKDSKGKIDYYSPDGKPLRKLFFRTPVDFTRISSGFSKHRWHPVLKRWREHKGVDYAAPSGTPVMATGDGTVAYSGWKKGYGRVVHLRHGRTYQTVYGHLSRIDKGAEKGSEVKQGDVIGYVGQSGMATGPHLHYEFHVNGKHRNPLTVKAPIADPLPKIEQRRFDKVVKPLLARLEESSEDRLVADAR